MTSTAKAKKSKPKTSPVVRAKTRVRKVISVKSKRSAPSIKWQADVPEIKKIPASAKSESPRRWWSILRSTGLLILALAMAVLMGVRYQLLTTTRARGGSFLKNSSRPLPVAQSVERVFSGSVN